MAQFKPSLKDRFWSYIKGNKLTYGEACFELRLSTIGGNNWRTNHLIDHLRNNATETTEDEIGLALHHAANNGHSDTVRLMLDKNCGNTKYKEPQKNPKFCNAAAQKWYELNKKLDMRESANRAIYGETPTTPKHVREETRWDTLTWKERSFCTSARNGDVDTMNKFIEDGVKIDVLDDYAICVATDAIHYDVFEVLLEHGADVTARNCEIFYTAIFLHATNMAPEFLETATKQDVHVTKKQMEDILDAAAQEEFINTETLENLLVFAGKMDEKPDVSKVLEKNTVKQNAEASALFKTFQRNTATPSKKTNGFKR